MNHRIDFAATDLTTAERARAEVRAELQQAVARFLASGGRIERLGNTPVRDEKYGRRYNNSDPDRLRASARRGGAKRAGGRPRLHPV